jgi:hypothetical protein
MTILNQHGVAQILFTPSNRFRTLIPSLCNECGSYAIPLPNDP